MFMYKQKDGKVSIAHQGRKEVIPDQHAYATGTFRRQLVQKITQHQGVCVVCWVLLCASFLFFHLSGIFFLLAVGCLIAAVVSVGPIWFPLLIWACFTRERILTSETTPIPPVKVTPPLQHDVFPTMASDETLYSFPLQVSSLVGHTSSDDPEATIVAWRPLPQQRVDEGGLLVSSRSDPGIIRAKSPNEDAILVLTGDSSRHTTPQPSGLLVVADGMGGHVNGKEASRLVIDAMRVAVGPVLKSQAGNVPDYGEQLKRGVIQANGVVNQRNIVLSPQSGAASRQLMGSTLTAALVIEGYAYVVNVGDSRTYLYRKSEGLRKLTRDHSVVASMVQLGLIEPDEIYTHPKRNQIYRCLGEKSLVDVDTFTVPLQEQDILLLCSDGLWEMVRDNEIESIIAASPHGVERIADALLRAALANGGADNVSVIVALVAGLQRDNQREAEFATSTQVFA